LSSNGGMERDVAVATILPGRRSKDSWKVQIQFKILLTRYAIWNSLMSKSLKVRKLEIFKVGWENGFVNN
jgi:hypothetical protein